MWTLSWFLDVVSDNTSCGRQSLMETEDTEDVTWTRAAADINLAVDCYLCRCTSKVPNVSWDRLRGVVIVLMMGSLMLCFYSTLNAVCPIVLLCRWLVVMSCLARCN